MSECQQWTDESQHMDGVVAGGFGHLVNSRKLVLHSLLLRNIFDVPKPHFYRTHCFLDRCRKWKIWNVIRIQSRLFIITWNWRLCIAFVNDEHSVAHLTLFIFTVLLLKTGNLQLPVQVNKIFTMVLDWITTNWSKHTKFRVSRTERTNVNVVWKHTVLNMICQILVVWRFTIQPNSIDYQVPRKNWALNCPRKITICLQQLRVIWVRAVSIWHSLLRIGSFWPNQLTVSKFANIT